MGMFDTVVCEYLLPRSRTKHPAITKGEEKLLRMGAVKRPQFSDKLGATAGRRIGVALSEFVVATGYRMAVNPFLPVPPEEMAAYERLVVAIDTELETVRQSFGTAPSVTASSSAAPGTPRSEGRE